MLKNYLKIAYRNLLKNKAFSLINILGLATGIAAFVLIFQYVQFELSYDTFQEAGENIYRVRVDRYHEGQLENQNAFTVPPLGPLVQAEIPGIAAYFRLTSWADSHTVIYDENGGKEPVTFKEENTIFADAAFVKYFSLNLLRAVSDSLLMQPNRVIISASTASRYFGKDWQTSANPLEKILLVYNSNREEEVAFMVEGIFKDMPQNSHLQYDMIFSHATLPNFLPKEIPEEQRLSMFENSWGPNAWYTYLVLDDQVKHQDIAQKITELVESRNKVENTKEEYFLQPIQDIHLHSHLMNEPAANGNATWVYAMVIIALIILCIAWINYINLSTARAVDRAKEVGLRKVIGARRGQLIGQFLLEASLINGIALILAITVIQVAIPFFNNLTGITLDFFSGNEINIWVFLGGVFLTGTFFTGFYPAFVLASYRPLTIVKGPSAPRTKGINLRKGLVVFQFAISLVLMTGTGVIYTQIQYMREQDLGIETSQIMVIEGANVVAQETSFSQTVENLRNEILSHPSIQKVSGTSNVPGNTEGLTRMISRIGMDQLGTKEIKEVGVDYDYFPVMGIDLLAGRNFSSNQEQNRHKTILNESTLELLAFNAPEEAIGAKIGIQNYWGVTEYEIIGVVKNYHQSSLQHSFEPLVFFNEIFGGSYIVQVAPTQQVSMSNAIEFLQTQWNKVLPNNPFNYYFLDTHFDQQYRADQRFAKIFGLFSLLAIIIACLGLFGLSSYTTIQRTKEIGIRKVLGASVENIVTLLSKDFILLVLIASFLALPLAYWVMHRWLENYAFRIEINGWLLALPVVLVLLLAVVTVSVQTIKTALTNPAKSLRYE